MKLERLVAFRSNGVRARVARPAVPEMLRRAHVQLLVPLVPLTVLLLHVGLMYRAALRHTGGVVSYPVDDAFIHLALAKQLAEHGIYGITPHEFAPVSSSIIWPLLLAVGIKVVGARAWLPLVFNLVLAVAIVLLADRSLRRFVPDVSPWWRGAFGVLLVALTPMPTLIILGMEHSGHTLAMIGFIAEASLWLAGDPSTTRVPKTVVLWAAVLTLWRYEGMFPVAIVFALATVRRRFAAALATAAAGAAPIVMFGFYLWVRYGSFLPLPVILKGHHIEIHDLGDVGDALGGDLLNKIASEPHVLAVAVFTAGAVVLVAMTEGFWTPACLACLITFGSLVFHVQFAALGWFFRYESYLMAAGITFGGIAALRRLPAPGALKTAIRQKPTIAVGVIVLAVVLLAPLCRRALDANGATPIACRNIFHQQMQSARFLASYFGHERVAVNDIGAVAWEADEEIVDLMGLATLPIARAKGMRIDKAPSPSDVERLTKGVDVAIVYEPWFNAGLPPTWLRLGRWRIETNRSCAFDTVSIYGTNPETYDKVIHALREFSATMPEHIWKEGLYLEAAHANPDPTRIRVRDRVIATFADPEDVSGSYEVNPDGAIGVRRIGPVPVRGLTADEARAAIDRELVEARGREHLPALRLVDVQWIRARSPRVFVAGRVRSALEIDAPATLERAIAEAGPDASAHPRDAWIWRETPAGFGKKFMTELAASDLTDGDIVVVP